MEGSRFSISSSLRRQTVTHHLEAALLTVMLHQEAVGISNTHSRIQICLLQQGVTQPHSLSRIFLI
ncbi:hypothetical protein JZ751_026250 [Albula glossodonta]|uniref:Uncharacterized protein n=1 Tax=Albula glossodonta TaxID=121402 RepID=A0A8T2PLC1_9TELE|nr:hypothetical protein JZ751_026250 [Albula glossodonta]